MKTKTFIMTVVAAVVWSAGLLAQTQDQNAAGTQKTEAIKVWGTCNMCKARIEKAAKVEGVVKAEWNKDTKILNLVYNPSIISSDAIQKKIAAVGHDTEKYRADDQVYNSLDACCHYERKK
jgi:periplasmic mercuric ion binding protein